MPDEICEKLSETFENGMTVIEAKGYYSDMPKTMIYFVINRFQVGKMRELIHEIDPGAYISISEIADIFGSKQDNSKKIAKKSEQKDKTNSD